MSDFITISGQDWRREISAARKRPNPIALQIRERTTPIIRTKVLVAVLLFAATKLSALTEHTFLHAIAQVESAGNAHAVGRGGELGLYQISEATWRQHSTLPFSHALVPEKARGVAIERYNYLKQVLPVLLGRQPTVQELAYAWKAGPRYCLPKNLARESRARRAARIDYGRRVNNLINEHTSK